MSSSARNFGALAHYLAKGRSGDHPERVAWSTSRNLPTDDPELAGKIMRATAAQNVRVKQPVYHLALSFDPSNAVDREAMERVADRVLAALHLEGHQVVIVAHRDRDHPHVHLLINRVHPETGLVWNQWQDRVAVQQVLRDEERALGLRVVPGRLASLEPKTVEHAVSGPRETSDRKHEVHPPQGPRSLDVNVERMRPSRVVEMANHFQAVERSEELGRERYRIEVDTATMRARIAHLEQTAERTSRAHEEFDRALGHVYREPRIAHDNFIAAVVQHGLAHATGAMHERPEQFGALLSIERARAFGLTHAIDDTKARTAAILAARAGHLAWEAGNALTAEVTRARAARSEDDITGALAALYENPTRARAAFFHLITEHRPAEAVRRLRESAADFGPMRAAVRHDQDRISQHAEAIAKAAFDFAPTKQSVVAVSPVADAHLELAMNRAALQQMAEREGTIRHELKNIPGRSDLAQRIVSALERFSPSEVRRLQSLLTPPQLAIAARLKGTVRDALLGKEDVPER